jgi:hypothetical protein
VIECMGVYFLIITARVWAQSHIAVPEVSHF